MFLGQHISLSDLVPSQGLQPIHVHVVQFSEFVPLKNSDSDISTTMHKWNTSIVLK